MKIFSFGGGQRGGGKAGKEEVGGKEFCGCIAKVCCMKGIDFFLFC